MKWVIVQSSTYLNFKSFISEDLVEHLLSPEYQTSVEEYKEAGSNYLEVISVLDNE